MTSYMEFDEMRDALLRHRTAYVHNRRWQARCWRYLREADDLEACFREISCRLPRMLEGQTLEQAFAELIK